MENTEDCPVKIQKMINELRKDHLGTLDRFLRKAYNLDLVQKSSWLKLRCVLVGKEKVTTRLELCSYEEHLCNMQDFLKNAEKQIQNQQKNRGIATVINTVPIILTDSEDEVTNIQSTSKPNENSVKKTKWTTPVPISDIHDQPVAIRDIRNSPRDSQFLPRHHAQSEINQRIPLRPNKLIVSQQNFNERPPPTVIIRDRHFNKAQSNQYFRKNTKNNPRVSHYQNDRQPHSSSRPERQESYRDYKLRKEQAERIARANNQTHQTNKTVPTNVSRHFQHLNEKPSSSSSSRRCQHLNEKPSSSSSSRHSQHLNEKPSSSTSSRHSQHLNEEPSSSSNSRHSQHLNEEPSSSSNSRHSQHLNEEPSSSSSSKLITALEPILSEFQKNFVSTTKESIINEPLEVAQPSLLEMAEPPLLEMEDDFFNTIIPQLDESYIRTFREIKQEIGFEILPPDEEATTEECPIKNANNEIQPFVKQEPEVHFSNMDENTADFIEHYQNINRQSITFQ